MKDFKEKVVVITGAATGIGASFAKECAKRGMKIALIDIAQEELNSVAETCVTLGALKVVTIVTDVSDRGQVKASVKQIMDEYGEINLMFSNAGVWAAGGIMQPIQDWEWTVGVNVMGTLYYIQEILPIFEKQKTPCHYLITSSVAGLMTPTSSSGAYLSLKHAVTALAEEVRDYSTKCGFDMGVSVFCPDIVATNIAYSNDRRPEKYAQNGDPFYETEGYHKVVDWFAGHIAKGYNPDGVALRLFRAIEDNQMYIVSHPYTHEWIKARYAAIEDDMQKEAAIYEEMKPYYEA